MLAWLCTTAEGGDGLLLEESIDVFKSIPHIIVAETDIIGAFAAMPPTARSGDRDFEALGEFCRGEQLAG